MTTTNKSHKNRMVFMFRTSTKSSIPPQFDGGWLIYAPKIKMHNSDLPIFAKQNNLEREKVQDVTTLHSILDVAYHTTSFCYVYVPTTIQAKLMDDCFFS